MTGKQRATEAYNAAVKRMNDAADALDQAADDITDEALTALQSEFDEAKADVERSKTNLERAKEIEEARAANPPIEVSFPDSTNTQTSGTASVVWARAKGSEKTESAYRVDRINETSFLRDLYNAPRGDRQAMERLERNRKEAVDRLPHGSEWRDMSDSSTAGAEFVPNQYLAELWVGPSIGGRPVADALPKMDLPTIGTTIDVPNLSSGLAVAARADAGAVTETDGVTATISHDVNEIAGQVDVGRIAVMRSNPPLDLIVGQTLVRRYNAYLDTQLLSGSGSSNQHDGLRNVSGVNTVTYTDASPTAAEFVPKVYDAIQQNETDRKGESPVDLIIMHPRRAAWVASNLSSTFPLFQLGSYTQAAGSQDGGFVETFAGLRVIRSPHVGTTYGSSTNEDEVYVVCSSDLILMEGPLFARVFDDVGSGNGLIRYQVFAHSAFLSNLQPTAIAVISGTGLAAPSF